MLIGRMFALLAAIASSATPVLSQELRDAGWTPWQVSGARATIGFLAIALWLRRDLLLARPLAGLVTIVAIVNMIGTTAYPYAAMHASMGTAVSMLYLGPIWVTLYQRWRGTPERFDIPATLLVFTGVVMVAGPGNPEDTWQGLVAGLIASLTQATYVVLSTRITKTVPPAVLAAWGMAGGAVVFGWQLAFAPWSAAGAAHAAVGIGLISGAFYFLCSMFAFARIGVETRMWLPFELIIVWFIQVVVKHTEVAPLSTMGAAFIFSAALLLAYGRRQPAPVLTPRPSS